MKYILIFVLSILFHNVLKAESFSVYGNSISTYEGYIPSEFKTWYTPEKIRVEETWWYLVGEAMGWSLCNNSSWSGSRVSYDKKSDYNSYFISPYRLTNLSQKGIPDNLFVLGGVNDWFGSINKLGEVSSVDSMELCGAYNLMLDRIKVLYPNTTIYCISILPFKYEGKTENSINKAGWSITGANKKLEIICASYKVFFINMEDCEFSNNIMAYTIDGLHPNSKGMKLLADYIVTRIKEQHKDDTMVRGRQKSESVCNDEPSNRYYSINGVGMNVRKKGLLILPKQRKKVIYR